MKRTAARVTTTDFTTTIKVNNNAINNDLVIQTFPEIKSDP